MFENTAESWLIFNRHFLSLSRDFVLLVPGLFMTGTCNEYFIQTAACEDCFVCMHKGGSSDTEDNNTVHATV